MTILIILFFVIAVVSFIIALNFDKRNKESLWLLILSQVCLAAAIGSLLTLVLVINPMLSGVREFSILNYLIDFIGYISLSIGFTAILYWVIAENWFDFDGDDEYKFAFIGPLIGGFILGLIMLIGFTETFTGIKLILGVIASIIGILIGIKKLFVSKSKDQ